MSPIYCTEEQHPEGDFEDIADADVAADLAVVRVGGVERRLWSVFLSCVADLLRECIDGATGD